MKTFIQGWDLKISMLEWGIIFVTCSRIFKYSHRRHIYIYDLWFYIRTQVESVWEEGPEEKSLEPKRKEVRGKCRYLYNNKLRNTYSSPNIFCEIKLRLKKWVGHAVRMGEIWNFSQKNLKGKPLGRPRCRWEDNIKTDLRETGCEDVNWIKWLRIKWSAFVVTEMKFRISLKAKNFDSLTDCNLLKKDPAPWSYTALRRMQLI